MKFRTAAKQWTALGLTALLVISSVSSSDWLTGFAEEPDSTTVTTAVDAPLPTTTVATEPEVVPEPEPEPEPLPTTPSDELTNEDIASVYELQQQKLQLQQQATQLQAARQYYSTSLDGLVQQQSNIEQQIALKQKEIDVNTQLKSQLTAQINATDEDLILKEQGIFLREKAISEKYEQLRQKLRTMSKSGTMTTVQMLISSDSYVSYLINSKMVSRMTEIDQNTLNGLEDELASIKAERDLLNAQRQALDAQRQPYADAEQALDTNKQELLALRAQANQIADQLNANITYYRLQYTMIAQQQNRLQLQINDILKDKSTVGTILANTLMCWPAPGCSVITSSFKFRWGRQHYGTDIAGWGDSTGMPIVAAADGVVIFAGWDEGGYGNYLMVDHGYDLSGRRVITLYAHCNELYVKEGDVVYGGQSVLAAMGSTGNSTGAHLHFEVRVDGTAVDAVENGYLPLTDITVAG